MRVSIYVTLHLKKHTEASHSQDERHRPEMACDNPILLPVSVIIKHSPDLIACKQPCKVQENHDHYTNKLY